MSEVPDGTDKVGHLLGEREDLPYQLATTLTEPSIEALNVVGLAAVLATARDALRVGQPCTPPRSQYNKRHTGNRPLIASSTISVLLAVICGTFQRRSAHLRS